jgi:hypothetical protein
MTDLGSDLDNYVLVKKVDLERLIEQVEEVKKQKVLLGTIEKALLLSKGGTLRTTDVKKLTGWSDRTMRRRIEEFKIPMIKDGRDFHITIEAFIEWWNENF